MPLTGCHRAGKRLILIGTKRKHFITAPTPSGKRPTIAQLLDENPEVEMPDYVVRRLKGKYRDLPIIVDPSREDAIAPTCVAHYAKDLGTRLVKDAAFEHGVRPFSIREYARLQGFPENFQFRNKRSSYKLIGNAVAVPVGYWIGKEALKYFN
jgi:DNA (cytosine-5)-methyltransferase 1